MVFGFVLLSAGSPHLYKREIMFSLSRAVGLRFPGRSSLLSKTDQPAAAEQRGNLGCVRGGNVTAQKQILHWPGFGGNESRTAGRANEGK